MMIVKFHLLNRKIIKQLLTIARCYFDGPSGRSVSGTKYWQIRGSSGLGRWKSPMGDSLSSGQSGIMSQILGLEDSVDGVFIHPTAEIGDFVEIEGPHVHRKNFQNQTLRFPKKRFLDLRGLSSWPLFRNKKLHTFTLVPKHRILIMSGIQYSDSE